MSQKADDKQKQSAYYLWEMADDVLLRQKAGSAQQLERREGALVK